MSLLERRSDLPGVSVLPFARLSAGDAGWKPALR